MQDYKRLAELVQERIDGFLAHKQSELQPLGSEISELLTASRNFLSGGKRFRALCVALGFRAVKPISFDLPLSRSAHSVILAATSLEFFHAAALVHDDVIDNSDTRRGLPAVHRSFAGLHRQQRWRGSAEEFGLAAAMLIGDLLQSWSDEIMQQALHIAPTEIAKRAREHYNRMRTEVALGQYLDVLEEQYQGFADHDTQMDRSTRVLLYKSAKYSVEQPLLIGAALAGASLEVEKTLSRYGIPAGVAFQLRDDVLGVFGDSELTGKPSGDDLIQGKRTVLATIAREKLQGPHRRLFDDMHGDPEMNPEQLAMLQRTIRDSGALEQVEKMISGNVSLAHREARGVEIHADAVESLISFADRLATRNS